MAKRRLKGAHGDGTVRQRKDGYYEARVSLGYDKDGKRIRKSIYGESEAEVIKAKNKLLAQYGMGVMAQPDKMNVEALMLRWLEQKQTEVKPTTLAGYTHVVHKHIIPRLGRMPVQKVENYHLEDFYRELSRKGLKQATVRQVHVCLHNAFRRARKWKLIVTNPAEDAELPQDKIKFQATTWTLEETRRFLEYAKLDRFYALYWLALTGSFRRGELLGLRWSSITLHNHPVHGQYVEVKVQHNRTIAGIKVYELTPKTERSNRPVILPYEAWEVLQAHKALMQAERKEFEASQYSPEDTGHVFVSPMHEPINPPNFYNRHFIPLLTKAKVPTIRFHDLRHTNITLDMASGGDLKTASQRAGHSNIAITGDVYQHPNIEQHLEATSRIARLISQPEGSPHNA